MLFRSGVPTERILKALEVAHLDDITLDNLVDLNGMRAALKTGESTLDQLFPEERVPGPKPETLTDKLQVLATVDPTTGEIKSGEGGTTSPPDGREPAAMPPNDAAPGSPPTTVNVNQRPKRRSVQERLQAEGDAVAVKGSRALDEWWDGLSENDTAQITAVMDRAWREVAKKKDEEGKQHG